MSLQLYDAQGAAMEAWPASDRAWQYGDGVFRTALVRSGEILDLPGQLAHLLKDAAALELQLDAALGLAELAGRSATLARKHELARFKWIITAGDSCAGYTRARRSARLIFAVSALPADYRPPVELDCVLCTTAWGHSAIAAGSKHLNRLEQVWARRELDAGVQEGLVCDAAGHLCSGTMSNLFWWDSAERLWTHPLSHCGVRGRTRARILEWASHAGQPLQPAEKSPQQVFAEAREIFVCNSLWGLVPVRACVDWRGGSDRSRALARNLGLPCGETH